MTAGRRSGRFSYLKTADGQIRPDDKPYYALADLIAPKDSKVKDYIGGFAVTAGIGARELAARYEREHDDYKSILVKALADRLAGVLCRTHAPVGPDEILGVRPG